MRDGVGDQSDQATCRKDGEIRIQQLMQTAQVTWHPLGRQMMISDFNEPVIGNNQSQYSSDGRFQVYAGIMQESSKNSSAQEIVKLGAYNCLLGRGYGNSGAQPLALVI